MKIRHGFVSNSSSSSFVALVAEDDWKKMLKDKSPIIRAVAEYLSNRTRFHGMDLVEFEFVSGNYDSLGGDDSAVETIQEHALEMAEEDGVIIPDEDLETNNFQDLVYDARREISKAIEKLGDQAYTNEQDF